MQVNVKESVGFLIGAVIGGLAAGKHCARVYHHLNPAHTAIFALSAVATALVLNQLAGLWYQDQYKEIPQKFQTVISLSIATLITGAIANSLGVPLMVSAALKVMSCSLAAGMVGAWIGRSGSAAQATESSPPPHSSQPTPL